MLRGNPLNPLAAAVIGICVTLLAATYAAHASPVAVEGGWPPPFDLSQSGDEISRGPQLALSQNGDLRVIWLEPEPGGVTFTVHLASYDSQGSNWTYSAPLAPPESDRYNAAMDVDQSGTAHAVWVEGMSHDQLWYAQLSGDSQGERHVITETNYAIWAPDVVVASGFAHAVWYAYGPTGLYFDVFYSRSGSGEYWSPATTTVETACSSRNPRLAADGAGDLHLVWEENTSPPQIYYISGTVGTEETVWSMPITVSEGLTQTATNPDIVVGSDNMVHVVFGVNVENEPDVQDVYYARFSATDTGVVSATLIPGSRVNVTGLRPGYASPAIALSGDDQVHVAWNGMMGDDYADRIYYAVSEDRGVNWSDPEPASPRDIYSRPDGSPSLAADDRFVYVVWQEMVSATDQDILYTRRFPVRISFPLGLKAY
jgi:hypothetical protein